MSTEILMKSVETFQILDADISNHLPLNCTFYILDRGTKRQKAEVLHDYVVYKWDASSSECYVALLRDEVTQNMTDLFYYVIETSVDLMQQWCFEMLLKE